MSHIRFVVTPLAGALALALSLPASDEPAAAIASKDLDTVEVHGQRVEKASAAASMAMPSPAQPRQRRGMRSNRCPAGS